MEDQEVFTQSKCSHSSWYQEGEGEAAKRCCQHCGFIAIRRNMSKRRYEVSLSKEEAAALRRRAGLPEELIERLTTQADVNRELGQRKKERQLYGAWAVAYVVFVLCFRRWLFHRCETRQQVIGLGVFLFAILASIIFCFVRAQTRISKIQSMVGTMGEQK